MYTAVALVILNPSKRK